MFKSGCIRTQDRLWQWLLFCQRTWDKTFLANGLSLDEEGKPNCNSIGSSKKETSGLGFLQTKCGLYVRLGFDAPGKRGGVGGGEKGRSAHPSGPFYVKVLPARPDLGLTSFRLGLAPISPKLHFVNVC